MQCAKCNHPISKDPITCNSCNKSYDQKCSGLTAKQLSALSQLLGQSTLWNCQLCTSIKCTPSKPSRKGIYPNLSQLSPFTKAKAEQTAPKTTDDLAAASSQQVPT